MRLITSIISSFHSDIAYELEHLSWRSNRYKRNLCWVIRGAAFRDLDRLDEAENFAMQAMECQPESHQPYTLMGAIEYDRSNYPEGDRWFQMAAERGADDTNDEIERIVRMTKDKEKRREVAQYLLDKDSNHYRWATSYLK